MSCKEILWIFLFFSIIWSDECKIELWGHNDVQFIRRPKNKAYDPKYVLPTVKHGGGSIMIHGFMSSSGVGVLTLIEVSLFIQIRMTYLEL